MPLSTKIQCSVRPSARWLRPVTLACCFGLLGTNLAEAGQPLRFPWACHSGAAHHAGDGLATAAPNFPPAAAYRVLALPTPDSGAAARPLQPMAMRPAYAYGWFGSSPSPQWGRHFGTSRTFTQWTQR